ncbi:MAG: acetate--CoA ligase family protein [Alphaproteobacteria bacterium]|nr:acetate--CoA ligase family protein [Alphaproteobacteria bacterium]
MERTGAAAGAAAPTSDLRRLFAPTTVALVGVSADAAKYTGRLLRYCLDAGMASRLRLVNPKYPTIMDLPAYPDLSALESPPDVVVAMVGPDRIPETYAKSAGAGFFIAVGDLVRRDHPDPAPVLADLRQRCAAGGPRIIGPQSLGVASPANGTALSISSALFTGPATVGDVALVTQSGGIMSAVIDRARDARLGFSHLVSCGGEADLEICDYVEHFVADGATRAIAVYAEGFRDPRRFLAAAESARAAGKPILLLKSGRTAAGAAAALSHSGRLTGRTDVQAAVFRRHGVLLVDDIDDLWFSAALVGRYSDRRPTGGVGGVCLSGGFTTVVGDALGAAGVPVAPLSPATVERLKRDILQPMPANPVDAGARPTPGSETDDTLSCLDAFDVDDAVGATFYAETLFLGVEKIVPKLAAFARRSRKPHLTCWQAGAAVAPVVDVLRREGVLVSTDLGQAVRALKLLYAHAAVAHGPRPALRAPRPASWIESAEAGALDEPSADRLLQSYGVPFVAERWVRSPEEAIAAQAAVGPRVVLKGVLPGCLHKTERGLVRVGLDDAAALRQAAVAMAGANPGLTGFRVQRMESGVELIVGIVCDPDFGQAILLGWGGIFAEATDRKALEALPIDGDRARAMIDAVDPKGILAGYRTGRALDRDGLVRLLLAVAAMAQANPRIREVDINPVMVGPTACVAVDAVIVLA